MVLPALMGHSVISPINAGKTIVILIKDEKRGGLMSERSAGFNSQNHVESLQYEL
jgi:hypothetical protein